MRCHRLIRDGATMVTSVDEILEELRYAKPQEMELALGEESRERPDLTAQEGERWGSSRENSSRQMSLVDVLGWPRRRWLLC